MKKIGIAGAGGLGSNIAMHLVRCGVLDFKIVDYDVVDESNLNRQFYFYDQIGMIKVEALLVNLRRINPNVKIEIINQKLSCHNIKDIFSDCDIIIEGFDQANTKVMLIEAFASSSKKIITASGLAGLKLDEIKISKIGKNIDVVGDMKSDIDSYKLFSPKILIVCSIMANLALKELGYKDEK